MTELGDGYWTVAIPAEWRLDEDLDGRKAKELEKLVSANRPYKLVDVRHPVYGAAMMTMQMAARQEGMKVELVVKEDDEIIYSVEDGIGVSLYHLRVFEDDGSVDVEF